MSVRPFECPGLWGLAVMIEVIAMSASPLSAKDGLTVCLVTDAAPGVAARHGLRKLSAALAARGAAVREATKLADARGDVVVVAGLGGGGGAAGEMGRRLGAAAPAGPEALQVRRTQWDGKPAVLVSGSDDRGLMYALLDAAKRVAWAPDAADPLSEVVEADEKPAVCERALSKYTMHRRTFEAYFHDPKYWERYLDLLAECRFNTFVLILGYENWGYFTPAYPYFIDVPGFGDVKVVGLTGDERRRNLESLNRLIRMTHERGLRFTLGIWDHIYRGGVQGPSDLTRRPTPGLVWGLTPERLLPYTTAGLAELLKRVPGLDAIQFRMHGESGLKRGEMPAFWQAVYGVMLREGRGIRFDARAKNFPDSLIDKAIEMGVPIRICTKYWAEQMGLPFHPTHINRPNQFDRRHGYADLLRYPRRYTIHWRLWSGGTTRVLLWGDPDYVRRFADSTHLYDGEGFEVNEPLATKMQDHPHDEEPFDLLRPGYRYCDWEFERYWAFFQAFGRVAYNPATAGEVWRREFEVRFGAQAGPVVERALRAASRVLPRIVACVFPYSSFPTTRGWVEKQRRGDLPAYAQADVSDTQQFLTMAEAARLAIEGGQSPKVWPQQTSVFFARTAEEVLNGVAEAERLIGDKRSKEFASTMVDLRILANLARFHSRRIGAGLAWARFEQTKDPAALDEAIARETEATDAWRALVAAAGDVYADDLAFGRPGAGLSGHWKDELAALDKGLSDLKARRKALGPASAPARPAASAPADGLPPKILHEPIATAPLGRALTVTAEVTDPAGVRWVRLRYRGVNQHFNYETLEMKPAGPTGQYRAEVPADQIDAKWDFMYFIEAMNNRGRGCIWPDLEKQTPYIIVRLHRTAE